MIKKTILGSLFMTCALTAGAQGIYQFADPGFEQDWTNAKEPGNGWHSFVTARTEDLGSLASFGQMFAPAPKRAAGGYQSDHSVQLVTGTVANANGNLTTGRINMGSTDPKNPANYNFSDIEGGQALEFAGTPDAVTFYAKFTPGSKNTAKQSRGKFILHDEYRYCDPEENFTGQEGHRVALAVQLIGESADWKQYTVPFTYDDRAEKPEKQYLLASFTTNPVPGGSSGDVLYIDDIYFVYNSELASLTYDSKPVSEITSTINLSDQVYDASKLSYTLTGKGATAERRYNAQTGELTLTVKGNDWSVNNDNQHEYTIQFAKPAPASEVVGQYNRWISVTLGEDLISESANNISLTEGDNGTVTFSLDYFTLVPGGDNMGPVAVPNAQLVYAADGSINITAPSQMVEIPGLEGTSLPIALSANMTADKKLTASLDIPLAQVKVTVGDIPFTTEEEGKVLKVTGTVSALGASSVKGESTANVLDLTGATLGDGLTTANFAASANDLFLITAEQTLTGNNVVKDGKCANLVLTDGQSFNAPEDFTASQITYNRVIAPSTDKDEVYTFVLPFALTADQVNGTVYDLTDVKDGVLDFKSVANLEANHPYLVVSNGTELLNNENGELSGKISATNDLTHEITGKGVAMVGAYEATRVTSDGSKNWYGYNVKGEFVKATTGTINPFRAAIKSTGSQSSFALKLDGAVTGIVNLENPNAKVDVYTISGVCVRKNVPAASALNGLSRGVYIVGGQKVVK